MFSDLKFSRVLIVFGLFLTLFISCGGDDEDDDPIIIPPEPESIIPSNLTLSITVVGKEANNPDGDGTGVIQCTASATDAVKYGFRFGTGSEVESATGIIEHTYTQEGTNTYTVYVYPYSSTGDFINTSQPVTVYVTSSSADTLVFSDEFDVNGSPDDSKWTYDIGTGNSGWGNNESQYYTKRLDNVKIEGGFLKITAQKESYLGAEYTSTRMKTQGKFDFTYGKVEVRAKLPIGVGTWPAIWMLGSNITSVGWPACGEADIMEHVGKRQGWVSSAMHTPSSKGNTVNHGEQFFGDVSTEFHVYAVEWTSEEMIFSVDGKVHYTYNPSNKNSDTWPFDANQFLILNVAMGGNWGGTIDPDFTETNMEIDYVRIYQ